MLSACAKPTKPDLAEQPKPVALDPRICADLKPEPVVTGSIVLPVTPEEKEVVRAFLTGYAAWIAYGREGWARAKIAKQECR